MDSNTSLTQKTVPEILRGYLGEALDLRYSVSAVPQGADQPALFKALQDYRARLDRIEYLMVQAVILKGRALVAVRAVQEEAQEKWDENLVKANSKRAASLVASQDFVAPKEKYAAANLATLENRRSVRLAEEELSWAETVSDALTKMYRGLDSSRQDLLTRIKAIPMVNSMEYTTS